MTEPEPLQQVARTYVRFRGSKLSFFGGCDYYRLSSEPRVLKALRDGLEKFGLIVSASRLTTGNHYAYQKLERELADFFGTQSALLVSSGYLAAKVAAEGISGDFTHALIDARSHPALFEAADALRCPVTPFPHGSLEGLRKAVRKLSHASRPIVLTDGMFSHDGSAAPLRAYREVLPKPAWMLIDDAHGAGVLGATGKGTLEHAGVSRRQTLQAITLSKAFGGYGGAVLCSDTLRKKMLVTSRSFIGSTPIPLPLACAASAAVRLLHRSPELRTRLQFNAVRVKTALRQAGLPIKDTPGPIVALPVLGKTPTGLLREALLKKRIYPPLIRYLSSSEAGYYRFVISSEHTEKQMGDLVSVLTETWPKMR